jgi:hypothetical protein
MDTPTLHWLAGLLEGDGHFGARAAQGQGQIKPYISINLIDLDTIVRVSNLFDTTYCIVPPAKSHWNMAYKATLVGKRAYLLMQTLHPLMGERRKQQLECIFHDYDPNQKIQPGAKLNDEKVRQIKIRMANGETSKSIAADFDITIFTIREIRQGKIWKHVRLDELTSSKPHPSTNEFSPLPEYNLGSVDWLAGLLEAEGSFIEGPPSAPNQHRISIQTTDEDVIARAAHILGCSYHFVRRKNTHHKNFYIAILRGRRAIETMKTLQPLMGLRRQAQIEKALASYLYQKPPITEETAREIKIRLANGERMHSIADTLNVSYMIVKKINQGRSWKHVKI